MSETTANTTPLEGALWLADHGFAVFPADHPGLEVCAGIGLGHDPATCTDRGKHPATAFTRGWTRNTDQVRRDFGGPLRNVGVSVGACAAPDGHQLVVVDSDRPGAIEDVATAFGQQHTPTMRVITSKGYHDYYWAPADVKLGNKLGALQGKFDGDIRAGNAYVIGPGSVHATGTVYELEDAEQPPMPIPDWLLAALQARTSAPVAPAGRVVIPAERHDAYTRKAIQAECDAIAQAPDGDQNNAINRAAFNLGTLVGARALSEAEAREALLSAARAGSHPEERALSAIQSGLTAGMAQPRHPWPPVARDPFRPAFAERHLKTVQSPPRSTMPPIVDGTAALQIEQAPHIPDAPEPRIEVSVDITHEPDAIINITDAIRSDAIPDTYVRNGEMVQVVEISGDTLDEERLGLKHAVHGIGPDGLRRLLARHADVYRMKAGKKDEEPSPVPASPTVSVCKAVLTETNWPNVRPITNIIGAPVLRPDGTVLQEPGYDPSTRLYYAPRTNLPGIPEHPTAREVAAALAFVLEDVLGDFPWLSDADRANYLALLVSPILQTYIGGLMPLGAISASDRGSGKTLLADVIGTLYGATVRAWVSDDDELRKAITAALMGSNRIITLDNVGERESVEAPSLAKLLTSPSWDDRVLGRSEQAALTNDRLWLVTGNNIRFGGDIAQRTVLVQLDPKCARPDLRTGFRIPDLDEWLEDAGNRAQLLHSLLLLCRAWIVSGAPRGEYAMRSFRRWARSLGGFLSFHSVGGFMTNTSQLEEQDEEAAAWAGFLSTWVRRFGSSPQTSTDLRQSAQGMPGFSLDDPWNGTFVTRADGSLPTPKGLGMMLASRRGRYFGDLVLRGEYDKKSKVWHYWVERDQRAAESGA